MGLNNKGKHVVLAIPDYHAPFQHQDAIPFLKWLKKKYAPDTVISLGDEIDAHSLSDYDHDPDGYSPGHELKRAIESLEELYDLFPVVRVCTSNHTARPFRKAFKHGIPRAFLRDYQEFLKAPKCWSWSHSWDVDGVRYEHGEGFTGPQGALKAALANMVPTVIGHIHSHAGIQYSANEKHLIYGFNVGCLINKDAYAFGYGAILKSKPIIGAGIIDRGVPTFIPMILDSTGRWVARK